MFAVVVVMLFVLVVGAVMFTDVLDDGFRGAGAALVQRLRGPRTHP
ncbi:hypothetical protein GCM10020366_29700 [Saccharopolyspora gregorii]|uniref:Uncharacterized protein n=1 Tax=Saccharopolyspora gregorii TaxID=33914 RepID=A0ABP6RRQ0_9PSEU